MSTEQTHEELLREVLDNVVRNNQQLRPGTPMAELKASIETALNSLPPLEFTTYNEAINNTDAARELVQNTPAIIGWDADKIIKWVQELADKV